MPELKSKKMVGKHQATIGPEEVISTNSLLSSLHTNSESKTRCIFAKDKVSFKMWKTDVSWKNEASQKTTNRIAFVFNPWNHPLKVKLEEM